MLSFLAFISASSTSTTYWGRRKQVRSCTRTSRTASALYDTPSTGLRTFWTKYRSSDGTFTFNGWSASSLGSGVLPMIPSRFYLGPKVNPTECVRRPVALTTRTAKIHVLERVKTSLTVDCRVTAGFSGVYGSRVQQRVLGDSGVDSL